MDRKITAINRQKKNPERLNIYLDGEFAFGLSRIVAAWLQVGQLLSPERIAELQAGDVIEVAYQKALKYLSYRARSESEVRCKLGHADYSAEVIDAVIEKLKTKGYIQDSDFAKQWVDNRNQYRPRGKRALTIELRQKGIEENIIHDTVSEMVNEEELAYQLGLRHSKRIKQDTWVEFKSRMGVFLYRRGFSYDAIVPVVQKLWSELQGEAEKRSYSNNDENEDINDGILG